MIGKDEIIFKHISIEGVMKSGKTKLANILSQKMGGKVVFDKIENPYLKDFYDEREGAALLAQLVFLVNRSNQQSQLVQRSLFDERIICDYLFEKDKIYAYQTLTDDELMVYEKIYNIFSERVPKPDLTIFLQVSLSTLLRRIDKEGTSFEKNISEKYLEDILEAFDYFFFNYQASPLLVIKADDLDLDNDEDIDDLLEKLKQMKGSSLFYVPLSKSGRRKRR
jgi:deoxyadenosine/deoxycytidine kinase